MLQYCGKDGETMEDYKKAYFSLFNALTDILELLRHGCGAEAEAALIKAQLEAEEIIISTGE